MLSSAENPVSTTFFFDNGNVQTMQSVSATKPKHTEQIIDLCSSDSSIDGFSPSPVRNDTAVTSALIQFNIQKRELTRIQELTKNSIVKKHVTKTEETNVRKKKKKKGGV